MGSPATTFAPITSQDSAESKDAQDRTQNRAQCVPTAVSDMFFNMRHPGYDRLYDAPSGEITDEAIEEAIRQDAKDMVGWLSMVGVNVSEDSLVKDYLKRR